MRSDGILGELAAIIRHVLERAELEVTGDTSATDVPGWDSFKMIEIIMEVERRFSITIDTRDMDAVYTVADLALRINDKIRIRRP